MILRRQLHKAVVRGASACVVAASLTACGGIHGVAPPPVVPSSARPASNVSATLRIVIPGKTTLGTRRAPRYISPATQSIAIAFATSGGPTLRFNQNLAPASNPDCKASLISPTVCTVTLVVAPGSYTADFATYDGLLDGNGNPTGNKLSANQGFPVTIVAGQPNAINVTLQGVPASLAFLPGVASGLRGSMSSGYTLSTCAAGVHAVTVLGVDADGNYILGPGAPNPSLTASSGGATVAIGAPAASAPNTFTLTPQSGAVAGQAVVLTARVTPPTAVPSNSGAYAVSNSIQLTYDANLCGAISEFPIPTANSRPQGLTRGPDGALWFTEYLGGKIGSVTTDGTITEYPPLPTAWGSPRPQAMIWGPPDAPLAPPSGVLWFTATYGLGVIEPGGATRLYQPPTALLTSTPLGITVGADGNIWYTEAFVSQIFSFDAPFYSFWNAYSVSGQPKSITAGPDGALWFTSSNSNAIGRITTAGSVTAFSIPTTNAGAEAIVAGPDGALWFTEPSGNNIGRITTAGSITEFPIPTANSVPGGITLGPDGALWFVEVSGNKIGRVTNTGVFTEFPVLTPNAFSNSLRIRQEIAAGADGAVWFLESGVNNIGRLR